MPVYLVLLGPPGAGKGTQAKIISENAHLVHVSSGDLFRENLKIPTELGKQAKYFMDQGELVPDDITIGMIRERLSRPDCAGGALVDGFPRTIVQAEALSEILKELGGRVNAVPYINVPEDVLIERLTGRWTCRALGHVYHMKYSPPRQVGVCDVDGSELYQRSDDTTETVTNRIRVYMEQTMPLIEFYRQAGVLVEVDGNQSIEQVGQGLLQALAKRI